MFILNIEGVIGWEITAEMVRDQLVQADGDDIQARLATPGGLVSEGILIYNELDLYPGNVDTHLMGEVASMGTYISQVGTKRTAAGNAVFFIHNVWGMTVGDHREMFSYGEHLDSLTNIIAKEYVSRTGQKIEDLRAAMDEETFYYGDEIKAAGFIDEITGDIEPDGRAEAISKAKVLITDAKARINDPEIVKKELKALSVMFAMAPHIIKSTPDNSVNKNNQNKIVDKSTKDDNNKNIISNQEGKPMTLEELKTKHPEIYAQIMALGETAGLEKGVTQERERVKGLLEMRGKFPKEHSQKVIDTAITEGHDTATLSINLMGANQANDELEEGLDDDATPPANGNGDTPEMDGDTMSHPEHVAAVSDKVSKMPGIL